jgi:hypothetical protein
MVCIQHPRASHYFGFGSEQQSNRHRVLMQFFSQGKLTKAIHMDAFPFIIALSFRRQHQPFGGVLSIVSRKTRCVIGLLSPLRLSPLQSGQDDPETAQWHVNSNKKGLSLKTIQPPFCSNMADGLKHRNDEKSTSVARILGGGQRTLTKLASNMTRSIFLITS